jgi:hypothetical protein
VKRLFVLMGAVFAADAAQAGFFQDLYQGIGYAATPLGGPTSTTSGGVRVNGQRAGRLRIVPDQAGQGYRVEFDRAFGGDALGRPEIIDLGNLEIELSGPIGATASFSTRGIPAAQLSFDAVNLNYSLRAKTGAQDAELIGTLTVANAVDINAFGFYDMSLGVSNANADLIVDGLVATGDTDTDFDVGPITIKGNIFADIAIAFLASIGADTSQLEGLFPRSPIDRIADDIRRQLESDAAVLGAVAYGPPEGDALTLSAGATPPVPTGAAPRTAPVPEPASAALLGLGLLSAWRIRRS